MKGSFPRCTNTRNSVAQHRAERRDQHKEERRRERTRGGVMCRRGRLIDETFLHGDARLPSLSATSRNTWRSSRTRKGTKRSALDRTTRSSNARTHSAAASSKTEARRQRHPRTKCKFELHLHPSFRKAQRQDAGNTKQTTTKNTGRRGGGNKWNRYTTITTRNQSVRRRKDKSRNLDVLVVFDDCS